MKVLYDFQIFQMQKYGGISRYFYKLIQTIGRYDSVEIFLYLGLHQSGFDWKSQRSLCKKSISIHVSQRIASTKYITALNYLGFNIFQAMNRHADILHLTYYPHKIFRNIKTKLVVTLYDLIQEIHYQHYTNDVSIERKRKTLYEADLILCISESTRNDLLNYYKVDPKKARVVYLGPTFESNSSLVYENISNPNPNKRPYLLFVGLRDSYKNFETAVKAYISNKNILKDYDLLCFSSVPFTIKEREFLKKNGIGEKTFYIGGNDRVLWSCYRHAHLLIYPSLYEGFGFPLLEAMEAGCPIAASNRGSIPEVMGQAGIVFDPRDESSIADAINKLAYDEILRNNVINKGFSRVKEFSWAKTVKETYEAYLDIIK